MVKVLVVEDSLAVRAFVRAVLEEPRLLADDDQEVPVDVVEASNGFEALRKLPQGPFDLVMTDINMSNINGLELIQFLRRSEQHRHTPIIIMSTQTTERDIARGLALGANDYLTKPMTQDRLRHAIVGAVRRPGMVRVKP
jgi:two-component system chemotaxis response regulator CheY